MTVYVESNFILELARRQEDALAANEILRLAESHLIDLAFPILAVCEPFSTLTYYAFRRQNFVDNLNREMRELGRSEPHKELAASLQPLEAALLAIQVSEMDALENAVQQMLSVGRSLPLDSKTFGESRIVQRKFGFSPQDAIVFASVMGDLRVQPPAENKCFISRNSKDFDDPTLTSELELHRCKYIARFSNALAYIRNSINAS